jgi:hypothetical protein
MKQLLSLFLFLLPCLAWAQYPSNGNQKITLGEQTTADGLIFRGVAATDTARKPSIDTMAYMVLDTTTNIIWHYKKATSNAWLRLNLLPSDTASMLTNYYRSGRTGIIQASDVPTLNQNTTGSAATLTTSRTFQTNLASTSTASFNGSANVTPGVTGTLPVANGGTGSTTQNFVDLTNTQTVGGAKTFNGNITISNLNPSGLLKYGGAISSPETDWNELTGIWAMAGTYPNARFYVSSQGGSYGTTFFQARNATISTPLGFFSSYNLFSGRTGIGYSSALYGDTTAYLTIKGSDATYPSLRINSGILTAAASAGAIDNNGTNLFFTPSTTRHTVNHGLVFTATLDFASTNAQSSNDQTIAATGAALGDVVSLGVPNGSVIANTSYSAWVSAAGTVTVRFNNYSANNSLDPAQGSFKVFVTK